MKDKNTLEMPFDELAKSYGVTIDGSDFKIPFDLPQDVFKLLMAHYTENCIQQSNLKKTFVKFFEMIENSENIEELKATIEPLKKLLIQC